jgi:hypothetical protein
MNVAIGEGEAIRLRDWLCRSDADLSPQATVLTPTATLRVAEAIVSATGPYPRTLAAGRAAVAILKEAAADGRLSLPRKELQWLGRIERGLEELPATSEALLAELEPQYANLYDPSSYGLPATANPLLN